MLEFDRYIKDAYLDLNDPNYQFVGDALEAKRHGNISELFRREGFEVEDDTDPNSDVCRTLILPVDGSYIVVKLSFVGPFAAVFAPGVPQTTIEKARKLIQENGLQVLDQEQLQQPCEIELTDIDARPMIYNALFSTDDMPT